MKRRIITSMVTALTTLFVVANVSANSVDKDKALFDELVTKHHSYLTIKDGKASGQGLAWLIDQGQGTQYYMIGERHGLAQVPQLSADIYKGLTKHHGFDHAALEFSPFGAKKMEDILAKGGFSALNQYLSSDLGIDSIAFMRWQEEAQMVADMYKATGKSSDVIWGLDQEFIFGLGPQLAYLKTIAKTNKQHQAIADMQQRLAKDKMLFGNLLPSEMQAFTSLFRNNTTEDANELLDGMVASNTIYGPWASPSRFPLAKSNIMREELIKQTLIKNIKRKRKETGQDPKVFFKFGGYHSATSVDTELGRTMLGNFVEEFAKFDNKYTFNVFMECSSGEYKTSGQDSGAKTDVKKGCGSYFGKINAQGKTDEDTHMFGKYIQRKANETFVVDLRPLRDQVHRFDFLTEEDRHLIVAFDAYVAIPNTRDSKSYNANR